MFLLEDILQQFSRGSSPPYVAKACYVKVIILLLRFQAGTSYCCFLLNNDNTLVDLLPFSPSTPPPPLSSLNLIPQSHFYFQFCSSSSIYTLILLSIHVPCLLDKLYSILSISYSIVHSIVSFRSTNVEDT